MSEGEGEEVAAANLLAIPSFRWRQRVGKGTERSGEKCLNGMKVAYWRDGLRKSEGEEAFGGLVVKERRMGGRRKEWEG